MSCRTRLIVLAIILGLDLLCVGLAAAIIGSFAKNFLLLGVVLIGETLFFLPVMLAFARLAPLDADHPALQNTASPAAVIARMEQTRSRLLTVELISGAIVLLLGLILLVFGAITWHPLLLAGSIVVAPLGFALVWHSFTLFHRRSAYEYARQIGRPASAKILKVTNTGWSVPSRSFDSARIYVLDIEVMPSPGAPYCVTLRQPIRRHPRSMPSVGATIPIKYLPEQPEVVVALLDPEDHPT